MESVRIAAAPRIVQPIGDGVARLCGYITGNSALATLLIIIGALVIVV